MSEASSVDTVEFAEAEPLLGAAARVEVDLGALSDQGKVRPNNEDHFLVVRFERSLQSLLTNLPPGCVPQHAAETGYGLLVADGMGGHAGGAVASRNAISILLELALRTPDWIFHLDEPHAKEVLARMEQRFHRIHEVLSAQGRMDPSLARMGTTLTLACSLGRDLLIVHVGDSRVYLFRQG